MLVAGGHDFFWAHNRQFGPSDVVFTNDLPKRSLGDVSKPVTTSVAMLDTPSSSPSMTFARNRSSPCESSAERSADRAHGKLHHAPAYHNYPRVVRQ
jgi:hypothetical protein